QVESNRRKTRSRPGGRRSWLGSKVNGTPDRGVGKTGEADLDARSAPEGRGPAWPESIPPGMSASDKSNRIEAQRRGGRVVEGACLESKCTVTPYRGFDKSAQQIWTHEVRPKGEGRKARVRPGRPGRGREGEEK